MESDAEYKAMNYIIKNDRRQRIVVNAMLIVAFVVFGVICFQLLKLNSSVKTQIRTVLEQQNRLVSNSAKESRTRTEESRRYITCLLILPQSNRAEDTQRYCFNLSDLPGGRDMSEFVPIKLDATDAEVAAALYEEQDQALNQGSGNVSTAYPNTTKQTETTQSNTSQSEETKPSLLDRVLSPVTNLIGR